MTVCNKSSLITFLFATASCLQGATAVEINSRSLKNIMSKFQKVSFGKDNVGQFTTYTEMCMHETFGIMDKFGNEISAVFEDDSDIFMQMMMCFMTEAESCTIDLSLAAKDLSVICSNFGGDFMPLDVKSQDCLTSEGGLPFTDFAMLSFPLCVSKTCSELKVDMKPLLDALRYQEPFKDCGEVSFSIGEKPDNCNDSVGMGPLGMSCLDIGKKPEKFCKKKTFQKFCPETCGLCGHHPCKDAIEKFKIGNKKFSCELAAKRPSKFCPIVGVPEHCPVACKMCSGGAP